MDIQNTALWKSGFSNDQYSTNSDEKKARDLLISQIIHPNEMHDKVEVLVQSIINDMPGLTVHDITHLDSLWVMSSIIMGEEQHYNPRELFVLAAAILIHDAGLTLAAYPNKFDDIKKTQEWQDSYKFECNKHSSEQNSSDAIPDDIERMSLWRTLRLLHGKQAVKIINQKWMFNGREEVLISNSELRESHSFIIGQIASSHNWSIDDVQNHLTAIQGPCGFLNTEWTLDPLKLACILRLADAMDINGRRAPHFRYILQKPTGVSENHWSFQSKLNIPMVSDGKLVFTSRKPFETKDADAWWECYDWIQMIDRELRDVDALMKANNRRPFKCNGVYGINTPQLFAKKLVIANWSPIDTALKITDVQSVINKFGGETLYGSNPLIALRELVQNASDAIRAKQALIPTYQGRILLTIEDRENEKWLVVEDDGIGMSQHILSNTLLDFGKSFWNSDDILDEHPGLVSKGFISGGRFGIGFFSVFMLGNNVSVISRRYDAHADEIYQIEFRSGLKLRPILTKVNEPILLLGGGTRVEILLKHGLEHLISEERLEKLFPALKVALDARINKQTKSIIKANDWETIDQKQLYKRTNTEVDAELYPATLIKDQDTGNIYGRATVRHHGASNQNGIIVDDQGIMITTSSFFPGIVRGIPLNVSRDKASLNIPKNALAAWASEQAIQLTKKNLSVSEMIDAATQILCAGGELCEMPFLSHQGQAVNTERFKEQISNLSEYWVFYDSFFHEDEMKIYEQFSEWHQTIMSKTFFRISPFFDGNGSWISGNVDRVLEISGVIREDILENPVIDLIKSITKKVWKCKIEIDTEEFFIPSNEYRVEYNYKKHKVIHIVRSKKS